MLCHDGFYKRIGSTMLAMCMHFPTLIAGLLTEYFLKFSYSSYILHLFSSKGKTPIRMITRCRGYEIKVKIIAFMFKL